jgi:antitoxin PrlF
MAGGKGPEKSKCCGPRGMGRGLGCCRIESIVAVDERGQVVLPKDVRERASIGAGDKLAVIFHGRDGDACCITLIKVDSLAEGVRTMLGPMLKEIIG